MKKATVPLAVLLTVLATGCGSPTAGAVSVDGDRDSSIGALCSDLAPFGGIGKIQTAVEVAEAADYGDPEVVQKAQKLVDSLGPIIDTADSSLKKHLETIAVVPRTVVDANTAGDELAQLELANFNTSTAAVVDACFPDKAVKPAVKATTGVRDANDPLIGRDTEVEAFCGTLVEGYKIEDPSGDVETFGQAWTRIAEGESCELHEYAENNFAWQTAWDKGGNQIPREEYRAVVEKTWGPLKDGAKASRQLERAISGCLYRSDDVFEYKDTLMVLQERAVSLELCPDHPQADEWKKLIENLPAAEKKEAGQLQKEKDQEEAKKRAEKKAEEDKARQAAEQVRNHARDGGKYLIGKTLNPGTYRTVGAQVTDCYWEISDAQGNIIDNNFISIAPQFELYIPATAAGFTINGCAMERIGN